MNEKTSKLYRAILSGDGKSWFVTSIQCGIWRVVESEYFKTRKEAELEAQRMNAGIAR